MSHEFEKCDLGVCEYLNFKLIKFCNPKLHFWVINKKRKRASQVLLKAYKCWLYLCPNFFCPTLITLTISFIYSTQEQYHTDIGKGSFVFSWHLFTIANWQVGFVFVVFCQYPSLPTTQPLFRNKWTWLCLRIQRCHRVTDFQPLCSLMMYSLLLSITVCNSAPKLVFILIGHILML